MKKVTTVMLLFWLSIVQITAQEQVSECDANFNEALTFLKEDKSSKNDQSFAINLLQPCADNGHSYAKVLLAKIYEKSNPKKAFKLYLESAELGNDIAMANLAVLYKYGKGCKLNFNKARKWFEKAADLGNEKAMYSLGYLYLKGFGTIDQNYKKAVRYFEKSNYPMAKYWLGVCYLNGYGVTKDTQKANELLGTSYENISTVNSETESQISNTTLEQVNTISSNNENTTLSQEAILGTWSGKLLQLDWSKTDIINKIDFEITFKIDENTGTLVATVSTNDQVLQDDVLLLDNAVYFDNSNVILPHVVYSESLPKELNHNLLSADIQLKQLGGNTYLTATVDSYIKQWNESGEPTRVVLKKKAGFTNSDEELSDDALKALSEQEESFIKLYPNPFVNDLIVAYTLTEKANVQVQITDLNGTNTNVLEVGQSQEKGEHRYFFNASSLKKGAYIVAVTVDGKRNTRLIVKK